MPEYSQELQHGVDRALKMAEKSTELVADLQYESKRVKQELGDLKRFSQKLLGILKLRLRVEDADLDGLLRQAEVTDDRAYEKVGLHVAPLCQFCGRPLQASNETCIYCGRKGKSLPVLAPLQDGAPEIKRGDNLLRELPPPESGAYCFPGTFFDVCP